MKQSETEYVKPYQNLSLENTPGEVWKDIPGLEGMYQASNMGRIKRLPHKSGNKFYPECIMKQRFNPKGYLICGNRNKTLDGQYITHRVNRLVAMAFIPNPDNLPDCDHIDEDKTNNKISNLQWLSRMDNVHKGTGMDRQKKTLTEIMQNRVQNVCMYDLTGKLLKTFPSALEAARQMNISQAIVAGMCLHKIMKSDKHGVIFRLEGDNKIFDKTTATYQPQPIVQYTYDGEYVATYATVKEAGEILGYKSTCAISACCNGHGKGSHGYVWRHVGDPFDKYDTTRCVKEKEEIVQLSLEGKYIATFPSMRSIPRSLKDKTYSRSKIKDCCDGKMSQANMYKWMYKKDYDEKISTAQCED